MLSKIASKQVKDENYWTDCFKTSKKIVRRNVKSEIKLTHDGLASQLMKRTDALTLKFSVNQPDDINEDMKVLKKAMKSLRKVRRVNIECRYAQEITGIKGLTESLKRLSSLESVSLSFKNCDGISGKGIKSISEGLQRCRSLKSINLNLRNCDDISDQDMKILAKGLKRLSALESITLECGIHYNYSANIRGKGLKKLSESLKRLCFLRSIDLKFPNYDHIRDEGLESISKNIIQRLGSLQSLGLDFSGCEITDGGLENLGASLEGHISLQALKLHFSVNQHITDEGLESLSKRLQKLNSLRFLDLGFYSCEITDRGVEKIGKGIEMLSSSLKSLNLHFHTSFTLGDLSESLQKLQYLQCLGIWDVSVEDDDLKGLSESLQSLIHLQSLQLYFQE